MTPVARLSAAIEVLTDIEDRRRPAFDALKDWGLSHRFAGSGDRVAIGNLVFDALRRRSSLAFALGTDSARALALGTYRFLWNNPLEAIEAGISTDRHAPEPLTEREKARLEALHLEGAPEWVQADVPEWLMDDLERSFGPRLVEEGRALAVRAPVDLRVNTLKATRDKVLAQLDTFRAVATHLSPAGIRLPAGDGPAKPPHVQSEPGYQKGLFEIQDEGSQIAALVAGAHGGDQVLDLCAGAGGKTLAIAAEMRNRGQIFAYDSDKRRFGDIRERLDRAGVRNVQIRMPHKGSDPLDDLDGRMNLVVVDAPCTGSGTWRRRPDAKWRMAPGALDLRRKEQEAVLEQGRRFVRAGGRMVYITCSVLPQENEDRIAAFLDRTGDFRLADPRDSWLSGLGTPMPEAFAVRVAGHGEAIRLTPATAGTDGFFVAVLERG